MGIHQLTKLLQEVAPGCVRERTLAAITSRKLAIDASGALYAYLVAIRSSAGGGAPAAMLTNEAGEVTSHLQGMFNRTIRMLEAGVKPIYVFDGKPPTMKSGELAKRRAAKEKAAADLEEAKEEGNVADMERFAKRTVAMTSDHQNDCKRLLRLMGVPVVEAPCEAEAQCAALAKAGKVFGVGSEDMDTLTFGAPVLVRRLTFSDARKLPLLEFRLDMVLSELGMTMPQFIDLCILCGCDYVDSIRGIGPKTALKLIKAHGSLEAVMEAIKKEGKFTVPEHFDFESARELFVTPDVADPDSLDISYKDLDEENLVKFLVEEKGFNPERVARGVEKLKKARKGGTQQRMDSFFTRMAPPAGSASKKKAGGAGAGAGAGAGGVASASSSSSSAPSSAGGAKGAVDPSSRNPAHSSPASWGTNPDSVEVKEEDRADRIKELAAFIYEHGDDRDKTRAVLCHIYHHAIHDRFFEARDLLLMSKLQDTIKHTDVQCQILFNRTMAQIGLAAFRHGFLEDAHSCLMEVCTGGRAKELLAQGMSNQKFFERDLEQEKVERRRRIPYHMHINLELIEACHLLSAMLLEVPNIAAAEHDQRRRRISAQYNRQLDILFKKTFIGPPESVKDQIMVAGLALADGEWEKCLKLVLGLRVWSLWAARGLSAVREMLTQQVKEVALQTYMHSYSAHYDSMSHAKLAAMFQLKPNRVHGIVSKMMINGELQAAWDQPTSTIVMHKVTPSRLQAMALEFADKVAGFVESNERMLAARSGSDRHDENRQRGQRGNWKNDRYVRRSLDPRQQQTGRARGYFQRGGGGHDRREGGRRR